MANDLIKLEGARQLRATLRAAGVDMQQVKGAHAKVARIAEAGVRAAAPRKSGTLASTVRSSGTMSAAIVRAGYARTPYPGPNNWGWPDSAGGIKGDYGGSFFMQQGAKATEGAWLAVYYKEFENLLDQVRGV